MNPEPRYGYHAFPRRDKTTEVSRIRLGLTILRSMVSSGLLLTPRHESAPSEKSPSAESDLRMSRVFASFTVRTPLSLAHEHTRSFGRFAIEFELDALVKMGALPVFYLPLRDDQQSHGRLLASRLSDIGLVLERLHNTSLINPEFEAFFRYLTSDTASLKEMLAAWTALGCLIERVEPSSRAALLFYEQREWRILKNVLVPPTFEATSPTDNERELLLSLDHKFWTDPVGYRDDSSGVNVEKHMPRIDRATFVRRIEGRHFLDYARRLAVPSAAVSEARPLVAELFPRLEVVAVESLGDCASDVVRDTART